MFESQLRYLLTPRRMGELHRFPLLAIVAAIVIAVSLVVDDQLVSKGCSPNNYVSNTRFSDNLESVLQYVGSI